DFTLNCHFKVEVLFFKVIGSHAIQDNLIEIVSVLFHSLRKSGHISLFSVEHHFLGVTIQPLSQMFKLLTN
ncbi:MAG: hypothetical protein ACKO96_25380, partial [Flammeovirgaceae bacterium]